MKLIVEVKDIDHSEHYKSLIFRLLKSTLHSEGVLFVIRYNSGDGNDD